jgi:hypothetical protein
MQWDINLAYLLSYLALDPNCLKGAPRNFSKVLRTTLVVFSGFGQCGVASFWPVEHCCFVEKNYAASTRLVSVNGNRDGVLWRGLTSVLSSDELYVLKKRNSYTTILNK